MLCKPRGCGAADSGYENIATQKVWNADGRSGTPFPAVTLVGSDAAGNVIQQRGFPNLAALNQWLASYEGQTALEYNRVWRVVSE